MQKKPLIIAGVLVVFAAIGAALAIIGLQRQSNFDEQVWIDSDPLVGWVAYTDTANDQFDSEGKRTFVLANESDQESIQLRFPALDVYRQRSTNEFEKLPREKWPEFCRSEFTMEVAPLTGRMFSDNYHVAVKPGSKWQGTNWMIVFRGGDGPNGPEDSSFHGCVVFQSCTEDALGKFEEVKLPDDRPQASPASWPKT